MLKEITQLLEEYKLSQLNLASLAARQGLAQKIATRISTRFHVVPYANQKDFE